jgi:hypothetical protein
MKNSDILKEQDKYFSNRKLYGHYRGIVESVTDPLMLGRVKVRVSVVYGTPNEIDTDHLPWAYVLQNNYGGSYEKGSFIVPAIGSGVVLVFEDGNLKYPMVVGSYYSMPIEVRGEVMEVQGHVLITRFPLKRSEAPIEAMTMINDKPSVLVKFKSDFTTSWEEVKGKFFNDVNANVPNDFGTVFRDRYGVFKDFQIGRINTDDRRIRMSLGKVFAGFQLKWEDLKNHMEISEDDDEIRISILGTPICGLRIQRDSGELVLTFSRIDVFGDVNVIGDLKVTGKMVGG